MYKCAIGTPPPLKKVVVHVPSSPKAEGTPTRQMYVVEKIVNQYNIIINNRSSYGK